MRKLILAVILTIGGTSYAQEILNLVKPMKCSNAEFVMNEFTQKWGEQPIWVGKTGTGTYITLLVNKEKKTWTVIEYDSAVACVLGTGEGGSNPNI
jgi:hypothetical protein